MNTKHLLIAASSAVLIAGTSQAAIMVNNSGSSGAFTVSDVDLIEGVTGVVGPGALGGQESTSTNPAVLTNGAFGTGGGPTLDIAETVSIGNNVTITWQLDTGASPGGYDITEIAVYSGWRDAGRDRLDFTVRYATVANPGVFIDIATVANYNPSPSNSAASVITDSLGTIASGVGEIQVFFPNQENGYVGYREIDVLGDPVPEPSSFALLGLGGLLVARRRRA